MKIVSKRKAIELLKKYANSEESFKAILAHTRAVAKLAVEIAKDVPGVDVEFIEGAALLHDIGRFKAKETVKHGIAGRDILLSEGLPEYASVAERHLGAGISKEDIIQQKIDLPLKDYVPVTKEEKIITHADNLIEINRVISVEKTVERFRKEVGEEAARRVKRLALEVENMRKIDE